ncbi:MAG: molybdopterin oxidoreductase family protein [bacterium]
MKLTRRQFIKGVAASGAVWGVRQLWPEELEAAHTSGIKGRLKVTFGRDTPHVCPFCAVGCGIISVKKEGRIISLEGDPANPINEGALCGKGQASIQYFRNDRRLSAPLKRTNPRKGVKENPGWEEISWEQALLEISRKTARIQAGYRKKEGNPRQPDGSCYHNGLSSPLAFLGSAAVTNEGSYLLKKLATLLGSNNIEHHARICHASTVAGLAPTFGFGAMTNNFWDLENSACLMIIGSNCAEAHPIAWRWINRARYQGAVLISVDPRYTRSSAHADLYLPIRPGTDIPFIYYLANYAVSHGYVDKGFLNNRTNTGFGSADWKEFEREIRKMDQKTVSRITGIREADLKRSARMFCEGSRGTVTRRGKTIEKHATVIYALGATQHTCGTQNVRSFALLQMLLGNIGKPGGGINALRGHSNVQGSTDLADLSHLLPGYIKIPRAPNQIRVYQDWKNQGCPDAWAWKIKDWYQESYAKMPAQGLADHAKKIWAWEFDGWRRLEKVWGIFAGVKPEEKPQAGTVISDLPFNNGFGMVDLFRACREKQIKALFLFAENPAVSNANCEAVRKSLASLDLLVVTELFETETAHFADYLLPSASFLEEEGSKTSSPRLIQWSHAAAKPRHKCKPVVEIIDLLYRGFKAAGALESASGVYRKGKPVSERLLMKAGAAERPCSLNWAGKDAEAVYREISRAVKLYDGMYDWYAAENLSRRRNPKPRNALAGLEKIDYQIDKLYNLHKNWGWSWPHNVRILYNHSGRGYQGERGEVSTVSGWKPAFTGKAGDDGHNFAVSKYYKRRDNGYDIWEGPHEQAGIISYYYDHEVVGNETCRANFSRSYFGRNYPAHAEPLESPVSGLAARYPSMAKLYQRISGYRYSGNNPVIKDAGKPSEYPIVLTTYSVSEHFGGGGATRHMPWLLELVPDPFLEISPELAEKKKIRNGDWVRLESRRGKIEVRVLVTGRMRPLEIEGETVHVVGMPFHWGFKGIGTGACANTLTIDAVDPTAQIPETKACLCRLEKV